MRRPSRFSIFFPGVVATALLVGCGTTTSTVVDQPSPVKHSSPPPVLALPETAPVNPPPEAAASAQITAPVEAAAPVELATAPPPRAYAPPVTPRGGGYYKDDGPHANPPEGLENIPNAVPRVERIGKRGNQPYTVFGVRYEPRTRVEPFTQKGVGSWYGKRFHGKLTSNGERYDMYAMSAAHKTLPIPSYAKVTNLANGRSIVVRVNDRGPFLRGRIIDLSYTAARKLGYIDKGHANVEVTQIIPGETPLPREELPYRTIVESVQPVQPPPVQQEPVLLPIELPQPTATDHEYPVQMQNSGTNTYEVTTNIVPSVTNANAENAHPVENVFLQLGVFASRQNAENFRASVLERLNGGHDQIQLIEEGGYFRVYSGPYSSLDVAASVQAYVGSLLSIQPIIIRRNAPD